MPRLRMCSRHCCSQGEALGESPTGWGSFPPGDTQATELTLLEASPWTHPSSEGGEVQPSRMTDLESHSTLGAAGAGLRGAGDRACYRLGLRGGSSSRKGGGCQRL